MIYYNIVVDLSWVACYLAAEYALTQKGKRINFGGMYTIEESYDLLRKAENLVTNPNFILTNMNNYDILEIYSAYTNTTRIYF